VPLVWLVREGIAVAGTVGGPQVCNDRNFANVAGFRSRGDCVETLRWLVWQSRGIADVEEDHGLPIYAASFPAGTVISEGERRAVASRQHDRKA